jgi:hypothetical protein
VFVHNDLPSFPLECVRDGLGDVPNLFEQLDDGQADELDYFHRWVIDWFAITLGTLSGGRLLCHGV